MRRSATRLALAALALLGMCSTAGAGQTVQSGVRGVVTDDSGGVLPGVTVVVTSTDQGVLATAVTDAEGGYVLALPAGTVRLTFQLDGFAPSLVELAVRPHVESRVVERLRVAPVTETVIVIGKRPLDPTPPLPQPPPRPAPPPPVVIPVPLHDPESVCGPAKPGATPESFGTIRSRRRESERELYAKGEELIIDGGTLTGLEVGRNLVVRRYYHVSAAAGAAATGEHTAGLLQIVAADERVSRAVVVYACDEVMKGDFLAPFTPEPMRTPDPVGIPAYGDAARILFADAGQMVGVARRLMVIDRGSQHGIRVGQRLTLFRRLGRGRATPSVVGEAVVVAIRTDSATIRVERANDVIAFGDWAAPQRLSPVASPAATGSKHP